MRKALSITLIAVIALAACVFASSPYKPDPGKTQEKVYMETAKAQHPNQTEIILGKVIESSFASELGEYIVTTQDGSADPVIWWDYNGYPLTRLSDLQKGKVHTLKGKFGHIKLNKTADTISVNSYKHLVRSWLQVQGYTIDGNTNLSNTEILQSRPQYKGSSRGNLSRFDLSREQQRAIEDYVDWYQGN